MKLQERIELARMELARLVAEQNNCPHQWGDPYRGIEYGTEGVYEDRAHGSDFYPEVVSSRPVQKAVWRRECARCGLKQTTEKTAPVIAGIKPVFD